MFLHLTNSRINSVKNFYVRAVYSIQCCTINKNLWRHCLLPQRNNLHFKPFLLLTRKQRAFILTTSIWKYFFISRHNNLSLNSSVSFFKANLLRISPACRDQSGRPLSRPLPPAPDPWGVCTNLKYCTMWIRILYYADLDPGSSSASMWIRIQSRSDTKNKKISVKENYLNTKLHGKYYILDIFSDFS